MNLHLRVLIAAGLMHLGVLPVLPGQESRQEGVLIGGRSGGGLSAVTHGPMSWRREAARSCATRTPEAWLLGLGGLGCITGAVRAGVEKARLDRRGSWTTAFLPPPVTLGLFREPGGLGRIDQVVTENNQRHATVTQAVRRPVRTRTSAMSAEPRSQA